VQGGRNIEGGGQGMSYLACHFVFSSYWCSKKAVGANLWLFVPIMVREVREFFPESHGTER
jgi:hypothetical protein